MKCEHCNQENPDDVLVCINCGIKIISDQNKPWHSLHKLLWGNKINQDILETLNELNHQKDHFIDVAHKLKKTKENKL